MQIFDPKRLAMKPLKRFIAAAFILFLPATSLAAPYQGVISDCHTHFKGKRVQPDDAIEAMDRNNIDVMVLWVKRKGNWYDSDTLDFAAKYLGRVIPGIGFQNRGWSRQKKSFVVEVREKAKSGKFKAMGEMGFRTKLGGKLKVPPDSPVAREFLDISEKYNLPLTIHHNPYQLVGGNWERTQEYETFVDKFLAHNTKASVIWDHWCGQATPDDARKLLTRFPKLTCELSWLHKPVDRVATPLVDENSNFIPGWKKLIEDLPDRFIVGTDSKTNRKSIRDFDRRVRSIRAALGGLSPRVAEMVATKNLHRIYGLK